MTVLNETNRVTFDGDGVTTSFDTNPIKFFATSDLLVYATVDATNVGTLLVEGVDYTVSGGDVSFGALGAVDTNTGSSPYGAPPVGETLTIIREVALTQGADFVQNDASNAEVAEAALDRITMALQRFEDKLSRSLVVSDSDVSGADFTVPTPEAGKVIGWDSTGLAMTNFGIADLGATVASSFWLTVLTATDAATSLSLLGGQPLDADLTAIAGLSRTAGDLIVGGASAWTRKAVGAGNEVLAVDEAAADKFSYVKLGAGDVRQAVLSAALDANGYNAAITTGSGLRPGLDASPTPMVLAIASGFGAMGARDLVTTISADVADPLGADLPVSNTSFLHTTYVSPTSVTWGSCLIPPQYGYAFDRAQGALLNFEGSDGATTMIDDFGNTWTAMGNAQIDTAQFKFGTSSLLLDGTGDGVTTSNITSLGDGSWEMSCWIRINALPGVGASVMHFGNTGDFGLLVRITAAGKLALYASSNGTSWDISSATLGTSTLSTATWYKVRAVFDALAGTYRIYLSNNGAAESQELSVSSTSRIGAGTLFRVGIAPGGTESFNGWIDGFRFIRAATKTGTETPGAVAPAITDYPVHFFSIPEMKMYEVTAASGTAGVNPTMTQRNRLFVGEADTGAATVTAVRNYALRGEYVSAINTVPAVDARVNFAANIGTTLGVSHWAVVVGHGPSGNDSTTEYFLHSHINIGGTDRVASHPTHLVGRNTVVLNSADAGLWVTQASGSGASIAGVADWRYRVHAKRTW